MENHEIVNKNVKGMKSEKIKVKTWFCDKDLKMLNSLNKTDDSLNNGYVEGSFITFLEPVGAAADPKSVVRNLVAPRIL